MNIIRSIFSKLNGVKKWFFNRSLRSKILIIIIILVIGYFTVPGLLGANKAKVQYQTAQATKGTLVTTVTESGNVVVANRLAVTTQASGTVKDVLVKDGDTVKAGQIIADLTLDNSGTQRQTQTYASYLSAQAQLANAQAQQYSLQSAMFSKWQTFYNLSIDSTYQNADGSPNINNRTNPDFITAQDDWLAAEAQYKNQQMTIAQDQAAESNALSSYQASSATITAPSSGTITDMVIAPGMQISSSATTTTSTAQTTIASIANSGTPIISVSLSEVDAAKVKEGQKATISFDALPNQTFTGKVTGINTTGSITSGVTTYPATIVLDVPNDKILPNMSTTANIITGVDNNVLLVPSAAVQTVGSTSTVNVVKNGTVTPTQIQIGASNDTQTEITSGLSEGDTVAIGYTTTSKSSNNTTSPFSRGIFGGGVGGNARIQARPGGGG